MGNVCIQRYSASLATREMKVKIIEVLFLQKKSMAIISGCKTTNTGKNVGKKTPVLSVGK